MSSARFTSRWRVKSKIFEGFIGSGSFRICASVASCSLIFSSVGIPVLVNASFQHRDPSHDLKVFLLADYHEVDTLAEFFQTFHKLNGDCQTALDRVRSLVQPFNHCCKNMDTWDFFIEKLSHPG